MAAPAGSFNGEKTSVVNDDRVSTPEKKDVEHAPVVVDEEEDKVCVDCDRKSLCAADLCERR